METPQNRKLYFELYNFSPFGHPYRGKEVKVRRYGENVGENIGNLKGT
jgi:hypothetical protein